MEAVEPSARHPCRDLGAGLARAPDGEGSRSDRGPSEHRSCLGSQHLEIAIKHALGKRGAPPFSGTEAVGYFRESGYLLLDVTAEHAAGVETLPGLHGDPFDRLIVAQALAEPLRLVTGDPKVAAYSDAIISF